MSRLAFALSLVCAGPAFAQPGLGHVWSVLDERYRSTYALVWNEAELARTRSERLLDQKSYSVQPGFTGSLNDIMDGTHQAGLEMQYQDNRWGVLLQGSGDQDQWRSGAARVSYTLASQLDQQVRALAASREQGMARLPLLRESMLFTHVRQLLQLRLQLELVDLERRQRLLMEKQGGEYLAFLTRSANAGALAPNDLRGLKLLLSDNQLRLQALDLEAKMWLREAQIQWDLDSAACMALPARTIVEALTDDSSSADYAWRMDSLVLEQSRKAYAEQDVRQWKWSVGLGSQFGRPVPWDEPADHTGSVFMQYSTTFGRARPPQVREFKSPRRRSTPPTPLVEIERYAEQARSHAQQARALIQNALERMRLGERGLTHEISQNLELVMNQELKINALQSRAWSVQLARLRHFGQLPPEWRPEPITPAFVQGLEREH